MLQPRAYVVICPSGRSEVSRCVGQAICNYRDSKDKRPTKYTLLDTAVLCQPGKSHSEDINQRLTRASLVHASRDELPVELWKDIFKEAFAQSSNPLGNFVIVNFPTPCSSYASPSIRDQFHLLENVCTLAGIVYVTLTEEALQQRYLPFDKVEGYMDLSLKVEEYIDVQYGGDPKDARVTVFKTQEVDVGADVDVVAAGEDPEADAAADAALVEAAQESAKNITTDFFNFKKMNAAK